MQVIAIIPARYASTRFPAKPLADIHGKPMLQHVYERSLKAKLVDDVIVATDDERIFAAARAFGARVVMTSAEHETGTDRLAEVAETLDGVDLIVNVQGDEPMIEPDMIDAAVAPLRAQADISMGTLMTAIYNPADFANPNVVKVVTDKNGYALYFSRAPIPYTRDSAVQQDGVYGFKHIGLYVYRRDFLLHYSDLKPTVLEQAEKLEQLRVLEHGYRIHVALTEHQSMGVDTPEDLERVRAALLGQCR
ncbi:MAG: 3-deoxy-manno-octulosonate cytidylyltransferase [Desulfuromonadaceae bacterium]|nr:3-deoxy-manno-octulosonate cytidylyltransferase [Desulfuromonas sp.]MDY0184674.1 3-deoxy-manno-octulosonate cytidylyltransferase [Desulfuromonadaceae bacterium]